MKPKTIVISACIALALTALAVWAFAPRPSEVETAVVAQGPFERSIDEDGKTQLKARYVISAPLAGRLNRIRWLSGDSIKSGDVVATMAPALSPMLDDRTLREQTARVESETAMLQRAVARVERARVSVDMANHELTRTEKLATQGFVSSSKTDTDRLLAQAAKRELESASQEQHAAEHNLEQARAALVAVRPGASANRSFDVRSPVDGRVLKVLQSSEASVNMGTSLVEIGDLDRMEISVDLLTTDALLIKPGTPVRIERWGGPGELRGHVQRVYPGAFTKVSALGVEEQRVTVIADIDTPREHWQTLGDGFRVGVRVIVTSVNEALQIPVGAVFPLVNQNGAQGVFVVRNNRAVLTPIDVGGRNGQYAWVTRGLSQADEVIVYPPTTIDDGGRVKRRSVKR
jgi:HlyD family secretion protein